MLLRYLDQNILIYVRDGRLSIDACDDVVWVYSSEHFKEILRGGGTDLLAVLERLEARELEVRLNSNWQITDQATLHDYSCPFERYADFLENVDEVSFDESLFTDVIARLAGGDNFEDVRDLPNRVQGELDKLLSDEEQDRLIRPTMRSLQPHMAELITALKNARPLEALREPLGLNLGRAGNISSENPILKIGELLKDKSGGLSVDQVFGFDPVHKQGYERWPRFLGIMSCHTMLNFMGYRPDKGISDASVVPTIISDGAHIAHAAFCDVLISADTRLCSKASAIYEYIGARTHVDRVELGAR